MLDEIEADGLVPVQLTNLIEQSCILLLVEYFQAKEDKTSTEVWMLLPNFRINLVKGIHKHFFVVFLDNLTFTVVLLQSGEEGSELDPIVAIFYVFQQHVLSVFFEYVKGEYYGKEIAYLAFESLPHLFLLERHALELSSF